VAARQQRAQRIADRDRTLVVIGIVFAQPLIDVYAGDFASVPGKLELTVKLTRVMLPFLTMVAVAAAVMGM
jgi:putative peptidoglycan lipid II flippase